MSRKTPLKKKKQVAIGYLKKVSASVYGQNKKLKTLNKNQFYNY